MEGTTVIIKLKSWRAERERCLFDEKRQGGVKMGWDVLTVKLTADDSAKGVAAYMATRSGGVTENYLHDSVAPVVLGRDSYDREAIFYELWGVGCHGAFFPVFLPGPVDMALWDICAKATGLPLHKHIGSFRNRLPVYASGNFHSTVWEYVDEALYYKEKGVLGCKAHPGGPLEFDMKIHTVLRKVVGPGYPLMSDPVDEYILDDAVRVARQLKRLGYEWFEEPSRDLELCGYTDLCQTMDIPIAATETARGCHWGVAQGVAQRAVDIVRVDVSWKDGVTGTLKIAHMADGFELNCKMHTITMSYTNLTNVHMSYTIRNYKYFEYFVPEDQYRLPMKGDLPIRDDHIYAPDKPGIGAELDWELTGESCHSYCCQALRF